MKIQLTGRHHITNRRNVEELENTVSDLESASSIIQKKSVEISFSFSMDTKDMDPELVSRTRKTINKLRDLGFPVKLSDEHSTAGGKLVEEFFDNNEQFALGTIKGLFDMDQYPLNTLDKLSAILDLAKRTAQNGSLYAIGSRNVRVSLGVNKEASNMRTIHELIHSLIPGENIFVAPSPGWTIDPFQHYKEIGESTSGFYLINPSNSNYKDLKQEVLSHKELFMTPPGFAIEYFTSLWSAINSNITTGYIYSVPNKYYVNRDVHEEVASAGNFIKKTSKELATTSIGPNLKKTLEQKDKIISRLSPFFTEKEIIAVLNLMGEELSI